MRLVLGLNLAEGVVALCPEHPSGGDNKSMARKKARKTREPVLEPRKNLRTAPGTLVADPEAPQSVVRVMAFGSDSFQEATLTSVREAEAFLGRHPVTWINVDGLGDLDAIQELGRLLGLHPLALEDVLNVHQRAKVDDFRQTLFVVCRMIHLNETIGTEQVSLFFGENFVLTFQEYAGDCFDPVRERIRKGSGKVRRGGPDYLAYALIDAIVDNYFPVFESIGERLEDLEDQVISAPDGATVGAIYTMKRQLLSVRRAVWPIRELLNAFIRDPYPLVKDETRVYFRDCYDHAVQAIDLLENFREITSSLMDVYLSSISNRMNEVMKVLTVFAAVFIPLTFIAGIFGMNFDREASNWNMPELGWEYGYPAALGLMAVVGFGMLAFFMHKGWIGGGSGRRKHE